MWLPHDIIEKAKNPCFKYLIFKFLVAILLHYFLLLLVITSIIFIIIFIYIYLYFYVDSCAFVV